MVFNLLSHRDQIVQRLHTQLGSTISLIVFFGCDNRD